MTTTETEKEIEVVAGVIEGVTQKKPDTWQVQVKPDGSQYTKSLWSKDAELVQSLTAKLGQHGAFVCGASYWTNNEGKQVRSLWINSESNGTENVPNATTADTATRVAIAKPSSEGLSKEEWRRKDIAADKRAYTAIAAGALQHTMPSDPSKDDLNKFMERVSHLTVSWMKVQNALRDGEDVAPFSEAGRPPLTEHDDGIPF